MRRIVIAVVAIAAIALFVLLGRAVDHRPDPTWLLAIEASWVNHSTLVAWWFTWFGYAYVLVPFCISLIVIGIIFPSWRWRAAFAIVALLVAWQGADFFQHVFARPRRLDWVVKHETAFSYPSSHAAIATGFYMLLGVFASRSAWRYGRVAGAVLILLGIAIMWSRLALAAHYLTDVLGGFLWGISVVAALAAAAPINVFEGPKAASLE
ncbi:MAG: phosphatase PAP2 family protein [Candidatus Eremiobacteraeota bacterium]|nr:phosphatase PAP2 family protein [Candidatus Eremiobacteraeota bacterium]